MVRNYSDTELLEGVKKAQGYTYMPQYLIVCVRSKADIPNTFDDKGYLFIDGKFKQVFTCTTHAGTPSLLGGFKKSGKKGSAIIKSGYIYYDAYQKSDGKNVRHHNGKMPCLRQVKAILYHRDGDLDNKAEEIGETEFANNSTNIHFNSYDLKTKVIKTLVGGWSEGCIVLNKSNEYNELLSNTPHGKGVSLVILNES